MTERFILNGDSEAPIWWQCWQLNHRSIGWVSHLVFSFEDDVEDKAKENIRLKRTEDQKHVADQPEV